MTNCLRERKNDRRKRDCLSNAGRKENNIKEAKRDSLQFNGFLFSFFWGMWLLLEENVVEFNMCLHI